VNGEAEQQIQAGPLRETLPRMLYRFEVMALAIWFVVRWLVMGAYLTVPIELPYIDGITIGIATLATLFGLSRWWPSQNVIAVAFLTIALSEALEHILLVSTGAAYPDFAGKQIFGVPWALPLLWVVAMLNARSVARLILWPHREKGSYGLWLILFTALMTALVFMVQESLSGRFYNWGAPVALCGVRFLAAVFFLAIVAPFLIPKGAVVPRPDLRPLCIWAIINMYLVIIAVIGHFWESAGILVVVNGILLTLALRARKKRKPKAPKQPM
jgi:hypothetical protein